VVGEAGNGEEAIRLARSLRPSVVLMDLQMPVLDGVAATRRLNQEQRECRVIVLTTFDDDEMVFDGLRAGAVGYLLKDAPSEKLAEAIRVAARGETFLQPSVVLPSQRQYISQRSMLSLLPIQHLMYFPWACLSFHHHSYPAPA